MNQFGLLQAELDRLRQEHLYRTTRAFASPQSRHVVLDGKQFLMLSSNSYLDFCNDPRIKDAAKRAIDTYGTGSGGARLTTGTSLLTEQLENALAKWKGTEQALVFNTGYMANVGTISAICDREWTIFSDELNHASIIDGCRLSRAKIVVYRHNDMEDLERKIQETAPEKGLIVSDGVFSMDGDIVNLPQLIALAQRYGLLSMIDEAHATGVIGKTGRGTAEHFGLTHGADITLGTLSKSIGSEGGFVCGDRVLIEYLKNKARSFIFSTALSPVTVATACRGVELMMESPERTQWLQRNVEFFCNALRKNGILVESETAIIPIMIGEESAALAVAEELFQEGFYISAIRYPTVAKGAARLRITLMATHTPEELANAAEKIAAAIFHHTAK